MRSGPFSPSHAREALASLKAAALAYALVPADRQALAQERRAWLASRARAWAQADLQASADRGESHPLAGDCPRCLERRDGPAPRVPCRDLGVRTGPATHAACTRLACPAYDLPLPLVALV